MFIINFINCGSSSLSVKIKEQGCVTYKDYS